MQVISVNAEHQNLTAKIQRIEIKLKTGQATFTKANILPLARSPPLQIIFFLIKCLIKLKITYKIKFGINKYAVDSIVSNEISILLSFLSADVTVQNSAFI